MMSRFYFLVPTVFPGHGHKYRRWWARCAEDTMKQVLIFVIVALSAWTRVSTRCFDEHELSEAARRQLRSRFPQPKEPSAAAGAAEAPPRCPVELYQQRPPPSLSGRSLSPWRYVTVSREDLFPPTYLEARCLCSGCILVPDGSRTLRPPAENHDYNSVPIEQSRLFLRRELCRDGRRYRLRPVSLQVAVGCTCVRPKAA